VNWIRVCAQSELLPGEFKIAWDGDIAIAVFNIDGDGKPTLLVANPTR